MENYKPENPFGTIESAQEYMRLLSDALREAKEDLEADVNADAPPKPSRQVEALRVALFSLNKLDRHLQIVLRGLNDLRSLRRLMWHEREPEPLSELPSLVTVSGGEPIKKAS